MKRIISTLLIVVFLIGLMPTVAFATTNEFAGGSGTESDPYLIETKYHLDNVRNYLGSHFKIIADIEFTDADFTEGGEFYNDGNFWIPIGQDESSEFTGVFDGDGHYIKNIKSFGTSSKNCVLGVFGYCSGWIKNLEIYEGIIEAISTSNSSSYSADAGAVVGRLLDDGRVENCKNSAIINASSKSFYANSGGIVGNAKSGTILKCTNVGLVTGLCAGGIVGNIRSMIHIDNCSNKGTIKAITNTSISSFSGGIVGHSENYGSFGENSTNIIERCFNIGNINAEENDSFATYVYSGGIIGYLCNRGTVKKCYNTGEVTGTSDNTNFIGGIVGDSSSAYVFDCYNAGNVYPTSSLGHYYVGGIVGETFGHTVERCYNVGNVTPRNPSSLSATGGIVGKGSNSNIVKDCYYIDLNEKGVGDGADGNQKCSEDELKIITTFDSFDFEKVWEFKKSLDYKCPTLKDVVHYELFMLELSKRPAKMTYYEGELLDLSGMELLAVYTDGYKENVTDYTIFGYDSFFGEKDIIVTYNEKVATFTINVQHVYDNACDINCNQCGDIRIVEKHIYTNNCDVDCNICRDIRIPLHTYTNACDKDCNICGAVRSPAAHKGGTATCKAKAVCTVCGASYGSLAGHKFGSYVYNNDATASKDGTKARTCSVCKKTETITATGTKLQNPFKDVKLGQYYTDPVLWAVGKSITNGTSAATFSPDDNCTRGQIVTFLWRAAGSPEPTSTKNPFKDVKSNQYYYKAVLWAVEKGITTGTSANTFSPDAACTRGQVVTFLWRAKGKPAASGSNAFKDVKSGAYYYDAVRWAVKNGITNGMSATSFAPDATCTRGQIVTFLYRAYN